MLEDAGSNTINSYASSSGIATPLSGGSSSYGINGTPRIYSRQLLSGNMRGTQNITGALTITDPNTNQQNISIDGSAQAITVTNTDGSTVGLGLIPGTTNFGFFAQDKNGNLVMQIVGPTMSTFDLTQSPAINNMQIGKLPDSSYGMVVAKTGKSVSSLYS